MRLQTISIILETLLASPADFDVLSRKQSGEKSEGRERRSRPL
jgi:hypothetical protein